MFSFAASGASIADRAAFSFDSPAIAFAFIFALFTPPLSDTPLFHFASASSMTLHVDVSLRVFAIIDSLLSIAIADYWYFRLFFDADIFISFRHSAAIFADRHADYFDFHSRQFRQAAYFWLRRFLPADYTPFSLWHFRYCRHFDAPLAMIVSSLSFHYFRWPIFPFSPHFRHFFFFEPSFLFAQISWRQASPLQPRHFHFRYADELPRRHSTAFSQALSLRHFWISPFRLTAITPYFSARHFLSLRFQFLHFMKAL